MFLTLFFGFCLGNAGLLHGRGRALIVTGLGGSPENDEKFGRLAADTRRLLVERGMAPEQVEILNGKVTRDLVLARLTAMGTSSSDEEFWLVLFGHAGKARGGVPAFQVSGPRLTAVELKDALDAIAGRQFVFVGTGSSGAFLPILQDARRMVLSATREDGQSDLPRFPEMWVRAFAEDAMAPFPQIPARAARLVEEEYRRESLAQSEEARLADPATGAIVAPPFGADSAATNMVTPSPVAPRSLLRPSEIKVEFQNPDSLWETRPATEETLAILAAARATPNPEGHSAVVLDHEMGFTVEPDRTTERTTFVRVYIAANDAVGDWANHFFPQSPPLVTTKLEVARVIKPDGSAVVFNPRRLPVPGNSGKEQNEGSMLYLPGACEGAVVEVGFRTRAALDNALPHVSETLPLQLKAPSLRTTLEIRVPEKPAHRVALKNLAAECVETLEHGRRVLRWELPPLPSGELMTGDAPWPLWAPHAAISSLESWEEFVRWYRRIAKGSDEMDDTVRQMADRLAAGASRVETIRRFYEFVSALRYVAIEIGVQGFRPRTPAEVLENRHGDCKDKANLLVALLRCRGINSRFVLVNRGSVTDVSFPSWQFNHALVFVPANPGGGQPDDLWLDATDGVTPFGYLPPGDHGRQGLVLGAEKHEFRVVGGDAALQTELRDEWVLDRTDAGWRGTFRRQATGLAEFELRGALWGRTPASRNNAILALLDDLWPGAEFDLPTAPNIAALSRRMEISANVATSGGMPGMEGAGLELFVAPTRSRDLWLNDGQPLTLVQTVTFRGNEIPPGSLPPPRDFAAAQTRMRVEWTAGEGGAITRRATLEFDRTTIPHDEYPEVRKMVRDWTAGLRTSPLKNP